MKVSQSDEYSHALNFKNNILLSSQTFKLKIYFSKNININYEHINSWGNDRQMFNNLIN
jgi:hypothetical protein